MLTKGISNIINGTPFWYGMGKAGFQGAMAYAISMGIGAAQSSIFSMTKEAATITLKEAALSGLGNLLGNFIPKIDIKIGDWAVSINPSILLGNSNGLGLNLQISYTDRHFSFNYGFSMTGYAKYQNTGKQGVQFRNSFMATFDDGKTGFSLGTNIWGGDKGMSEFNQRTGMIGLHFGDFRAMYENDGGFGIKNLGLGDRNDSHRTAALNMSVGDYTAGFNLFTGERPRKEQKGEEASTHSYKDRFGVYHKNAPVNEIGTKYRLGALTVGYKGFRMGVDSEHVRHAIQNAIIHRGIDDNEFMNQSWDWKPYFQYQTPNQFSSW